MTVRHLCPRCGALQTDRGLCISCKKQRNQQRELMRGERPGREGYATRAYRTARTTVLEGADTCAICGLPPTDRDPLTVDHADGNTMNNDPSNLRPAHHSCNSGKRGRSRS